MVVAAGAEERGSRAELRHHVHAEDAVVELDRRRDVGHPKVHVPHHGSVGETLEGLGRRVVELAEEALDVEGHRRQPLEDLALPELARPVGVDLDAVVVGIAQIDRLAHVVIREPLQLDLLPCGVREPLREARAVGNEKRDMVEAGVPVVRLGSRLFDEADELAVGAERRGPVLAREDAQADGALPVVERPVEIADRELDPAHVRLRRDLHRARRYLYGSGMRTSRGGLCVATQSARPTRASAAGFAPVERLSRIVPVARSILVMRPWAKSLTQSAPFARAIAATCPLMRVRRTIVRDAGSISATTPRSYVVAQRPSGVATRPSTPWPTSTVAPTTFPATVSIAETYPATFATQ